MRQTIETNKIIYFKGILQNVTLDNVILDKWTMCLTNNFIPNFQKKLTPKSGEGEDFLLGKASVSKSNR